MSIELLMMLVLISVLASLMVHATSRTLPNLRWEALDSRLKKFKKESIINEEDRPFLEMYVSLELIKLSPPNSEGKPTGRLI